MALALTLHPVACTAALPLAFHKNSRGFGDRQEKRGWILNASFLEAQCTQTRGSFAVSIGGSLCSSTPNLAAFLSMALACGPGVLSRREEWGAALSQWVGPAGMQKASGSVPREGAPVDRPGQEVLQKTLLCLAPRGGGAAGPGGQHWP